MQNNLRAIRREKGLASWGLSVTSGVSTSTLTAIEKWNYIPTLPTCNRIAAALGVEVGLIWPKMGDVPEQEAKGEQGQSS